MSELPSDEQMKIQAQAHFAEYQAMMTRMNTFMAMQFTPLAPWIAFLAFIAVAFRHLDRVAIVWGTALVTQVAIFIYCFALHEVYAQARHIETQIKPRVALLLNLEMDSFWGWEKHLKRHGKAGPAWIGDTMAALISVVAFGAGMKCAEWASQPGWDWLGATLSFVLMCVNLSQGRRIIKARQDLEKATATSLEMSVRRVVRER